MLRLVLFAIAFVSRVTCRLTLINSSPIISRTSETHMYCLDTSGVIPVADLSIKRVLDTGNGADIPTPAIVNNDWLEAVWGRETGSARYGVFFCAEDNSDDKVITSKIFRSDVAPGVFSPRVLSVSVSSGDDLTIEMSREKQISVGVTIVWRHNGQILNIPAPSSAEPLAVQTYHFVLRNVSKADGGIYEIHPSDNRTLGAMTRVIVRGCRFGRWNPPECDKICPNCQNGGICDDANGNCICPPGFMGTTCSVACGANKYGETCDHECDADGCGYSQFCLPDPYGCTCATGWKGSQCNHACDVGTYGPDCKLTCDCQNGGICDRYRGCMCTDGWSGMTCESPQLEPPVPLNSPTMVASGSDSLTIDPNTEPYSGSGPIEAATVVFKKTADSVWVERALPASNFTFYVLRGLDHDVEYEIKIRLTGTGGNGEDGPKLIASTTAPQCQALTESPELTLTVLGSRSINVTWQKIESMGVRGYEVAYKEDGGHMFFREIDSAEQTWFLLEGLSPYTTYMIGVAEINCAGEGPTSPLMSVTTREDAPGQVRNLRLYPHSSTRILATWSPPSQANGVIRRYDLTVYENGLLLRDRVARSTTTTNYVLSGLRPYTNYRVVVQAYTIKTGESADKEIRTPEDAPDGPPTSIVASDVTSTTITFTWEQPEERRRNGIITRYEYIFRNAVDGMDRRTFSTRYTSATFDALLPGTLYSFQLRAYTDEGPGPYSEEVRAVTEIARVTGPDVKVDPTTLSARTSAILRVPTNKPTTVSTAYITQSDRTTVSTVQTIGSGPDPPKGTVVKGIKTEVPYGIATDDAQTTKDAPPTKQIPPGSGELSGSVTSAVVMVIGIICGVVLILLLACAVCFMIIRSKKKKRKAARVASEPPMRMSELQRQESENFHNDYGSNPSAHPPMQSVISLDGSAILVPAHLDFWRIPWEKIIFEDRILAEGNFGRVMKADIKKDDNNVIEAAVKVLKDGASDIDRKDFIGELEIMCKVGKHPNIVSLVGACENAGVLYVATEYANHGNLLNLLRKSRCLETDPNYARDLHSMSTYDSEQLLQFAADVALGMKHLCEKGCVHRDLAARNILVYDNYVAKVADFGLSRGDEVYVKMTAGRLPVRWMAIESLNYSVYTTKSDVWSFGILLWEIITLGGTPYPGLTCAELYQQLPRGYRMPKPLNCDNEIYELMRHCWRERPYDRPDFAQIYIALKRMVQDKKPYVNMSVDDKFKYEAINSAEEAEHASKAAASEREERQRLLSDMSDGACASVEC